MIYVDDPMPIGGKFNNYCHLWSDGDTEELHTFAASIGLRREWFQDRVGFPHYDISLSKRQQAIKRGATATTLRQKVGQR